MAKTVQILIQYLQVKCKLGIFHFFSLDKIMICLKFGYKCWFLKTTLKLKIINLSLDSRPSI